MKKNIALLLLLLLILAGCSNDQPEPKTETTKHEAPPATQIVLAQKQTPFTAITAQEAQQLIADKANLLILDVRTSNEIVNEGAIAGSQHTSLRTIFQNELALAKDTPILLVCAVGGRSYAAGQVMVKYGFQNIYNLRGGLDEWKKAGLPVTFPQK